MQTVSNVRETAAPPSGRVLWWRLTAVGALSMTVFDGLLLQKSKAFFTGGFLAPLHTSGPLEAAAFLLASFVVDLGFIGPAAALLLVVTSRLRLTAAARSLTVLFGGMAPLLFMDFVSYRLLTYLGDAFDLGLMFELTGSRPGEIVAVAAPQLWRLALLVAAAAAVLLTIIWSINRFGPGRPNATAAPWRPLAMPAVAILVAAVITTTVASLGSETFEDGLRRKPSGRLAGSLVASLTDVDRDGFGLLGGMRDVELFDASVYPWALDAPGNGIDENGVGGDLPAQGVAYVEGTTAKSAWVRRPDVVLVVLESFRADAVGRQVDGRSVTPVLDRLALEGISSTRAYSHNGYTAQSRFHLLSGSLAGLRHGTSLIDDFAANGYETAYFSAQDESFGGEELGVGFDRAAVSYDARRDRDRRYSTFSTPGSLAVSFVTLEQRIAEFLATRDRSRPLFLYVNFHDTHYPYHHAQVAPLVSATVLPQSQIAPANQRALQEMYFNTAANVDAAVGRVLGKVAQAVTAPPAVIVTADHGESLFDEGFLGHGYALNDVQTRIPFIVRGLPLVIEEPFGQVELRDAIGAALSMDSGDQGPTLVQADGKSVFQYLGNINRPRQIGHVLVSGHIIYDFRKGRVIGATGGGNGAAVHEQAAFLNLVHGWERLMLARAVR